ncbi:MAG: large protein [Gemmatimonadetes bacterium]|nr:large protein [Gemmatimonadota bacterium]
MHTRLVRLRWCAAPLVLLAAACTDAVLPAPPVAPAGMAMAVCVVNVPAATFACTDPRVARAGAPGVHADRILGGQDVYVRLASSGTAYDAGTEVLSSNVTVQNLLQQQMGTPDGSTVTGVKVFFHSGPVVVTGSGSVSVKNADGTGLFTSNDQPYFDYNEILTPYQISSSHAWQFNVSPGVTSFTFTVYVSAALSNESGALLDRVWTGAVDSLWTTPGNWQDGVVPDSLSTVAIPADSLLASHRQPVLSAEAVVTNLRVGYGSTLSLNGFGLEARGNVESLGTITSGSVRMTGAGALLGGSTNALVVTGGTRLQRATTASGAVAVTGALNLSDHALSISIP